MFTVKFINPSTQQTNLFECDHVLVRPILENQLDDNQNHLNDGFEVQLFREGKPENLFYVNGQDWHWPMAVIENSHGRTTQVIRAPI